MRTRTATLAILSCAAFVACQTQGQSDKKAKAEEKNPALASQGQSPGTTAAGASSSGGAPRLDPGRVVLSWDGGQMTYGELQKKKEAAFKKLHNKYMNDLFAAEQEELEGFILQTLVEKAAKAAGKSPDEYVESLAGTPQVTDEEVLKFYDGNVKQSGQPFEAVKDRIRPYLEGQKKQEKVRAEFDKLKSAAKVKIDLPPPETSVAQFALSGRPMKGKADAKVTIVEFSDFECPYCSKATPGVMKLLETYPNDVKIYFLHYPLSFHKTAMPAAIASHCAHKQDKFWAFHDKLFANQHSLNPDFFKQTAKELGLDESKFVACLEDPSIKDYVNQDMEQGNAAGVEGTPSFFINGAQYPQGVPSVDAVKAAIDRTATN